MKRFLTAFALLAIVSIAASAFAADPATPTGKAKPGVRGRVEKIDGTKITVKTKDGESVIDTDDNTKFTVDGNPGTLADVKEGERLMATPETGVATDIKIMTKGKKSTKTSDTPTTAPTTPSDAK